MPSTSFDLRTKPSRTGAFIFDAADGRWFYTALPEKNTSQMIYPTPYQLVQRPEEASSK